MSRASLPIALLIFAVALAVWNGVLYAAGLWASWWWLALGGNFVLLVMIAERIGRAVPLAHRKLYERTLAFGFPVVALIAWQMIVDEGILNPLWFPQPTRIAQALWDVTVNYDRFSQTSLLGRPWLIPQEWSARGWAGVYSLFAESHVWATVGRVFAGFVIGSIPGLSWAGDHATSGLRHR